jgi:spermidine synthase
VDGITEVRSRLIWFLPVLGFGSGVAALIYEITWLQSLELVVGASAVSLTVLLATFMGGMCLGSLALPRLLPIGRDPLRWYAAIELFIGIVGLLELVLMPIAGRVYTAWSGYGLPGFLLRGIVASACLLPPAWLMGAAMPALARRVSMIEDGVSWLGLLYAGNIGGAVLGCLLAGFYLLREFDVMTASIVAAGVNFAVAIGALALSRWNNRFVGVPEGVNNAPLPKQSIVPVYIAVGFSGFCALAAESIFTRTLGLLFGASVYTLSILLAVFLTGLGIGSGIGSLLARKFARPSVALGCCQVLAAGAVAWTAHSLAASLPFWPIDLSLSSNVWINFQLDLVRAFWALLPPTLLWGATFPLAIAVVAPRHQDAARLFTGVFAANTLGAIAGSVAGGIVLVVTVGTQRAEQGLIGISLIAGLILFLSDARRSTIALSIAGLLLGGLFIRTVPAVPGVLIAYGRYASTWVGKSDILYSAEGMNASVAGLQLYNRRAWVPCCRKDSGIDCCSRHEAAADVGTSLNADRC